MPIERLAAGPLYLQLKSILQRQIDTGELQPGDMLPSLRELCRQYEVSSITVRRALQELVNEGRLQSQQGIGTFVTTRNRRPRLALVILGFIEREWRRNSGIFGDLIAGAATVAWEREALFSVTRVDPERDVAGFLASIVAERFFDGLLVRVLSDAHPADLQPVREAGLPYVVIKRYTPGVPTNCVVVDDVRAACEATSHLLAHGCRRIAFVCPQGTIVGRDRHEGYRRALAEHGLSYEPELVPPVADWFEERGYAALKALLALPQPPQAVFAAGDMLAIGAYRAAAELGLRIPQDLAVVGYDDIPAAATLQPPLTTVRTSYYDFGARATALLLDLIAHRVAGPQRIIMDAPLVVRGSCGEHAGS
ncbi:MAG TPA: GntR family transcriptional regulator [Anaerolineae bacterium]|nr:GntR family transcriptional regulator [Anaerolineae bacterium]HOR01096.1 GntR family transcriptional regulator [Anaerolineae bacterium]HPL29018.1 GntR family transcriptional regulator [Anaerolineae bacterium]